MLNFDKKNISSNISKFHMFTDETDNYDISGKLCNFDYNFCIEFQGVRQMLERLEVLFDCVNLPQATHHKRSFHDEPAIKDMLQADWMQEIEPLEWERNNASFLLHVQFRRHSTWQGTLELIKERKVEYFRSELELLSLLANSLKK